MKLITTPMTKAAEKPPVASLGADAPAAGPLVDAIMSVLDDAKAEDIISIDLAGKTSLADAMIIASGRSDRHVGAIADRIAHALKDMGQPTPKIEGVPVCDWVLIDAGDIIVHLFRPEVRGFYNLEKLWGMGRPKEGVTEDIPRIEKATNTKAAGDRPATAKSRPRVIRTRPQAD